MNRFPLTFSAVILVGLGALLFVAACGEDDSPTCPVYEVGVLEGYVTSSGEGVSVNLRARARDNENPFDASVETDTDSTGYYRMELPSGLYRMEIRDSSGFYYWSSSEDTVRIGPGTHHLDMSRGRLVVSLTVPDYFEDQRFRLDCRSDGGRDCSGTLRVADGKVEFDFGLIIPGVYRIQLDPPSNTTDFYLPDSFHSRDATTFEVGDDEIVRYEQDLTTSYSSISGGVTGSWVQGGQGNFTITAYNLEKIRLAHAFCESDGSFFLPILLPQSCRLITSNNGMEQWIGGDDFDTATVFDLQAGNPITDLVHAESGLTVLLEGPGVSANSSMSVLVRSEAGQDIETEYHGNNPLHLSNLRPGRYFLFLDGVCHDETWAPTWFGGNEDFDSAIAIELGVEEMKTIVMDLREGGRIEGGVRTPLGFGNLVTGYRLYDEAGETICNPWIWNDEEMLFTGLPDGTFHVAAEITNSSRWYYPGTWDPDLAKPVTITDYDHVVVEWDLPGIIPEVVR